MPPVNIELIMAVKDVLRQLRVRDVARFRTSELVAELIATDLWDAEDVPWAEVDRVIHLYHYGKGVHKVTFSGLDSQWAFGPGGPPRSRQI